MKNCPLRSNSVHDLLVRYEESNTSCSSLRLGTLDCQNWNTFFLAASMTAGERTPAISEPLPIGFDTSAISRSTLSNQSSSRSEDRPRTPSIIKDLHK